MSCVASVNYTPDFKGLIKSVTCFLFLLKLWLLENLKLHTASLCWAELLLSPSSCFSLCSSQAARPLLMVLGDGVGMGSRGRVLLPFIILCGLASAPLWPSLWT